jgi:hypothetical protein
MLNQAFFSDTFITCMYTGRDRTATCGLKHELSSLAEILGSWVPIPLEAWMSVCVYSVFVLSCVQVAAFRPLIPLMQL